MADDIGLETIGCGHFQNIKVQSLQGVTVFVLNHVENYNSQNCRGIANKHIKQTNNKNFINN